jgi:hypothetical protein
MRQEGWRAGFLGSTTSPQEIPRNLISPDGRLLIIVDYADTRRNVLVPLLRKLYQVDRGRIRLLLLARAALDWWEQLKTESDGVGEILSGPATTRQSVTPLVFATEQRAESYRIAAQAFAERLKAPTLRGFPEDLDGWYYERALLLHMSALAAVQGDSAKGEDGVLDHILNREQWYWSNRARERQLAESLIPGIRRAMAVITLGGGAVDEKHALEVLQRLQLFRDVSRDVLTSIARLLHEIYPGDRWIEPVLPDLLGEHLVQREMQWGSNAAELLDLVLGPRS